MEIRYLLSSFRKTLPAFLIGIGIVLGVWLVFYLDKDKPAEVAKLARVVSAFKVRDAEGAPSNDGHRYHAAVDYFAPTGTVIRSPVNGKVVQIQPSRGNSGQVYGGVVKIRANVSRHVYVFRHVLAVKSLEEGQMVSTFTRIAKIAYWRDGPEHAHIEVWKTLEGGYRFENMIDPAEIFAERTTVCLHRKGQLPRICTISRVIG